MEEILRYIREKYHPSGLILYGSYAAGTQTPQSDFDALAVGGCTAHDVSAVAGVPLDLYVYPKEFVISSDGADFLHLSGGRVLWDADGTAAALLARVDQSAALLPQEDAEELEAAVQWCEKMLCRAQRGDAEGNFRRYWLLTESLNICCSLRRRRYLGPRKALKLLQWDAPELVSLYTAALAAGGGEALAAWVRALRRQKDGL